MDASRSRIARLLIASMVSTAALAPLAPLAPSAAHAQTAAASDRAQREAAEHDRRGHDAVKRADAETARLEFLKSYALVASPRTLWSLLSSEIDSGHPLAALEHVKAYLADPGADPKKIEQGRSLLAKLTPQIGHLRIDVAPSAPVTIDGARITPDERANGIDLMPGNHIVEAVLRGRLLHKDVDVAAGNETLVSFEPPGRDAPEPSTPNDAPLPAPASASASASMPAPAPEKSHGLGMPPTATWILGGVAVAAFGAGIAFSLSAQSKKDEIASQPAGCTNPDSAECAHLRDLDDAGRRQSTLGWIAYGGGAAALIAGGLIWFFAPKGSSSAGRAHVVPVVPVAPMTAPGIAGIRLQTRF